LEPLHQPDFAPPLDSENSPQTKRILIVDDNGTMRKIVRQELEQYLEFTCDEAANGLDAVRKARDVRPHLVIMDWAMPVMNGFEAAMALRREMPNVPVVLLTMYAELAISAAETACVKAVIGKTDGMTAVVDCVQRLLGS
jgi:CheY-like chemotaxis protein